MNTSAMTVNLGMSAMTLDCSSHGYFQNDYKIPFSCIVLSDAKLHFSLKVSFFAPSCVQCLACFNLFLPLYGVSTFAATVNYTI